MFTEHDSLQAILSFADVDQKHQFHLAENVTAALDWCRNSWVFLGDSFPDWLPRVRLLFNAKSAWQSRPADGHVAIDRRFGWPRSAS